MPEMFVEMPDKLKIQGLELNLDHWPRFGLNMSLLSKKLC